MFFRSFRSKLFLAMVAVSTVPAAVLGTYAYFRISSLIKERAFATAQDSLVTAACELRGFLDSASVDVLYLSRLPALGEAASHSGTGAGKTPEHVRRRLEEAFVSFGKGRPSYGQLRYIDEKGHEVVRVDLDGSEHRVVPRVSLQDKSSRYYVVAAMQLPRGHVFVSPFDLNRERDEIELPYRPVVRYATPVFDSEGERQGIVVINVLANRVLARMAGGLAKAGCLGGASFVADGDGYYLYHTDAAKTWGGPDDLNTDHSLLGDFPWLRGEEESNVSLREERGSDVLVYQNVRVGRPEDGVCLTLGQAYHTDEILASVGLFRLGFLGLIAASSVVSGWLALILSRRVTEPVQALRQGAERIGSGDLEHRIAVGVNDEIGALANSFNGMANALREHIAEVQEATAARERTEGELRTAHDIQQSILPHRLPPGAEDRDLDLYATSVPARHVGGDLYEFFFKNDGTLVVAMGDVSGKGAPAALLMTMVWVLTRAFALEEDSPAAVLARVNRALLEVTEPSKFVTMFLGFYDTKSRRLTFVNAGHCAPIVVGADGGLRALDSTTTVVGAFDDFEAEHQEILLRPAERLIVYSDGITDARNAADETFGAEGLEASLAHTDRLDLGSLVERVMSAAQDHQSGQQQFDDMTVLAMAVKPGDAARTLERNDER